MTPSQTIRNFAIIAHIDHGKSTLADRLIQATETVDDRNFRDQILDDMDLERERGITIKSHPVVLKYTAKDGQDYTLNLIDTPGHVDFTYEVSRSLAACEGAILLIDASQGVQAQTVANTHLAEAQNLTIIPVINKIDLPAADVAMCLVQLEEILAIPAEDAIEVSAKDGTGVDDLLEIIIARVPPPNDGDDTVRALIYDALYNPFRGVINYVRVVSGEIRKGSSIRFMSTDQITEVKEVGIFTPDMTPVDSLGCGSVGYLIPNIKTTDESKIGDTITLQQGPSTEALPGFKQIRPVVFSSMYPIDTAEYDALKDSLAKLQMNDAAFEFQAETSVALGFGFRCGFLGLLHMEIIQERLRREYNMDIIATYPSVVYRVHLNNGDKVMVDNPVHMPDPSTINRVEEPLVNVSIITPTDYLGTVMNLIMEKRGTCGDTQTMDQLHVMLSAVIPLQDIIIDFHDKLKTITRGYGSMDYEPSGYQVAPMVKLEMLVNGETVDAFAIITHRDQAESRGRQLTEKLAEVIPEHLFKIPVQAVIGGRVVARSTVRAMRKDVTAKCYGGDITRKRKLLDRQKEGKKKMKQFGKVNIPQDAFIKILQA